MLTKQSKYFIAIFTILIICSLAYTFYDVVVEKNFRVFVSEDEIPDISDSWNDLIAEIYIK